MPTFELTVLGSSGGPLEGATCSILMKPANIQLKDIIKQRNKDCLTVIDAGSAMGKFCEIVNDELNDNLITTTQRLLNNYSDTLTIDEFNNKFNNNQRVKIRSSLGLKELNKSPVELTFTLIELLNTWLITHSHLDHISGLVMNSAAFGSAFPKNVFGLPSTIQELSDHIFNDQIWPNLTKIKEPAFLKLNELKKCQKEYQPINSSYRTIPFVINHGKKVNTERYHSTSFLIQDIVSNKHILVFGDVESDQDSQETQNHQIWRYIKPLIQQSLLDTIIIECSTPNLPPNEPLFGHLTPNTLFGELMNLNSVLLEEESPNGTAASALNGFNVLITHVKDRNSPVDPKKIILQELNEMNDKHGLGFNFVMLLTGQTYLV